jgi:hypothetical protein
MSTLERAIAIAAEAHAGQIDKAGQPYVLHPLRVMLRLATAEERVVGVLHDVVEDCRDWTIERLQAEGFSEAVLRAVEAVTSREGEPYEDFIARAADDPIGRRVKFADLEDNCDLQRINNPTRKDYERIEKYKRAISYIRLLDSIDEDPSSSGFAASPSTVHQWIADGRQKGFDYLFLLHDSFSHDDYYEYSSIADFSRIREKYSHQEIDMQWISQIIPLSQAAVEHQKSIGRQSD